MSKDLDAGNIWNGKMKHVGGSRCDDWNQMIATQTVSSQWLNHSDPNQRIRLHRAALVGLDGIAPKDELEGMLAAQLIAVHNAAMESFRRAMLDEQTFEGRRENLSQANRLSRTFTQLVDALNRNRSKGQQNVTVRYVHVQSGGQAVVGLVGAPGGRGHGNLEEQPHARGVSDASQPAMWSEDTERSSLPRTGDAERSLPHARRTVTRRTKGK